MRTIILLFVWLSLSASALSQNLVAYYPFNGNANDESGNGRHGTVMNGALLTADRFNQDNKAYYFDGDDDFIEFSAAGLPATDRTVMFWLNPVTGNQPSYPICYGGVICGYSFLTGFNASSSNRYNTQGHCGSNALATDPWTISPENSWLHFAVSFNGSAIKIYINGQLAANNSDFTIATYTDGRKMFIGALITPDGLSTYDDGSGGNFKGKLDDVRIYDAALSDAQLQAIYISELNGWPLPVTLLNLHIRKTNSTTAQLIWQTAAEINNKGFEVQRSFDGNYFVSIGFVNGAGNSNDIREYSITDIPGRTGRVYYRLKQIDFDGNSKLSTIVSVLFDKRGVINIYPNPAKQRVTIEGADLYTRIQLLDAGGRLIKEQFNNGLYLMNMSLDGLKSGMYLLRLSNNTESQTLKLVIVK